MLLARVARCHPGKAIFICPISNNAVILLKVRSAKLIGQGSDEFNNVTLLTHEVERELLT